MLCIEICAKSVHNAYSPILAQSVIMHTYLLNNLYALRLISQAISLQFHLSTFVHTKKLQLQTKPIIYINTYFTKTIFTYIHMYVKVCIYLYIALPGI